MGILLLALHHANYTRNMSLCKQSAIVSHCCFFTSTYSNSCGSIYTNINTNISCESCYWLCIMRASDAFYTRDMSLCKQSASVLSISAQGDEYMD
jgi:hypothetical protein